MDIRLFGLNHRRVVVEASVFCRSTKSSPQESCISNLFSCQILRNICECLESLRLSASLRLGHGFSLSQASYKVAPDEGCLTTTVGARWFHHFKSKRFLTGNWRLALEMVYIRATVVKT